MAKRGRPRVLTDQQRIENDRQQGLRSAENEREYKEIEKKYFDLTLKKAENLQRLNSPHNPIVPTEAMAENSRFLRNALEIMQLPEVDLSNANAVRDRIAEYFSIVDRNGMKPGVAGLAASLGVSRRTLYFMAQGLEFSVRGVKMRPTLTVVSFVQKAYQILETQWEDNMQNGKINPASGIFLGKNNFGYSDVQEHVIAPKQERDDVNTDQISSRYIIDSDEPEPIDSDGSVL